MKTMQARITKCIADALFLVFICSVTYCISTVFFHLHNFLLKNLMRCSCCAVFDSEDVFPLNLLICKCDVIDRYNTSADSKHYVVRREIIRSETNSTRWYLNGKASSLKAVRFRFNCFFCCMWLHAGQPCTHSVRLL